MHVYRYRDHKPRNKSPKQIAKYFWKQKESLPSITLLNASKTFKDFFKVVCGEISAGRHIYKLQAARAKLESTNY